MAGPSSRKEIRLDRGWEWKPGDGVWRRAGVPGAWQRSPGGWNYRGSARYRIELPPPQEEGQHRWLRFDGVQYRCRAFYRGKHLGGHEGGWDPFWLPLPAEDPGGLLEVVVESIGPGLPMEETPSGFLPDCGLLPCGLWKEVFLVEGASTVVENVLLRWMPSRRTLRIKPLLLGKDHAVRIRAELSEGGEGEGAGRLDIQVPSPRLWGLDDPFLYTLRVTVEDPEGRADVWEDRIGLRHLKVKGKSILLNNEPILLRGALHWGYDPQEIAPTNNEAKLHQEMDDLKRAGFNLVKHCLYVPHERYFGLGDTLGMLQWLELPMWLPSGSQAFEKRVKREYPRITAAFQHHPSLVLYSLGCELSKSVGSGLLKKLHSSVKRLTPNALLCDNSGSGDCYGGVETGLSDFHDYHFYAEPTQLEPLVEQFNAGWRQDKPMILGEFCDCDVFRNLEKIRATLDEGALWWLKRNVEENPLAEGTRVQEEMGCLYQEERLAEVGLSGQEERIEKAANRHAMAHRKMTLETVLSHPSTAGYVVTGMRDTPVTTSGLYDDLNAFRFDAAAMRTFNHEEVLLLLPPPRRAWIRGGDRSSSFDRFHQVGGTRFRAFACLSHYGSVPRARLNWSLKALDDRTVAGDDLEVGRISGKGLKFLSEVNAVLPLLDRSTPFKFTLSIGAVRNQWPLFIHPPAFMKSISAIHLHDPLQHLDGFQDLDGNEEANVWLSPELDGETRKHLEGGGAVILIHQGLPTMAEPFWREACHLVGDHPLVERFPFQDGGGEELSALTTDRFFARGDGLEIQPILSRLDMRNFTLSHSLVEIEGYRGRILATTLNLAGGPGRVPQGLKQNRAGTALLAAMLGELDCANDGGGYSVKSVS